MFNVGAVYHANYQSKADIVINQGGTDSGKTYGIMQLLFTIACSTKAPQVDGIITILNQSVPDSKKGAYRIAQSILIGNDYVNSKVTNHNQSDRIIYFSTGWVMEFVGATDEQNAKQGKRQYLFVNEAQGISWPIFWQMAKRTRVRTFIDYNPTAPFWAHEKLIGTTPNTNDLHATVQLIISDHRHNPFLSEKDHAKTENIKDPELHRVYARGLTGNLTGLIYPNWIVIKDSDFPRGEKPFGGLDFGYTNDPTCGVDMRRIAESIFIDELCYEPGIPARRLHSIYKAAGYGSDDMIYCEHDKDMIRELRVLGLLAVPARKGANSIAAGISKVKEYRIHITERSKNILYERTKYMWTKDDVTGKFVNVPTDVDNHAMDAIRYGIHTQYYRNPHG